jgi:hypothetical protein
MVSIIVDSWTPPGMKFNVFGILAFYIDKDWKTRRICLAMHDISEKSGTDVVQEKIFNTLKRYNLQNRILSITGDNGSHISINQLKSQLLQDNIQTQHRIPWIRCFVHNINLICQELYKIKNDRLPTTQIPNGLENIIEPPAISEVEGELENTSNDSVDDPINKV